MWSSNTHVTQPLDNQACANQSGSAPWTHKECYILFCFQQPSTEITADGASAYHKHFHCTFWMNPEPNRLNIMLCVSPPRIAKPQTRA